MARFVKSAEHDEIFKIENGEKYWIQDWSTFVLIAENMKITWQKLLNQVEIIHFEELKDNYPVGETMLKKTVTTIIEGKKPREIFYPEGGHQTDRLYKMLYVCPSADANDLTWVDEAKEVGFNVVHTYTTDKHPWEKALDKWLQKLKERNMYGCLQLPHSHIENFIEGLSKHENGILSSVEEPDAKAGRTSKKEQMRIYEIANKVGLPVWGCLNWGPWKERVNFKAFDLIMTDSYPYSIKDGSVPLPGSPAAQNNDPTLPWWTFAPKMYEKFKMMREVLPKNMPVICIQQGFYLGNNVYPNIQEEWDMYNKEFGLNSFAVYPHGYGQGYPSVMNEERIKAQCKELMKKLDK
ncbi:MAG TPA: hypothetical protein ENI23_09460 [bacterium]|nr:hypothetical protein [bacterium]